MQDSHQPPIGEAEQENLSLHQQTSHKAREAPVGTYSPPYLSPLRPSYTHHPKPSMGLRKIRIEYWEGVKILVLRDDNLPRTYEEFAFTVCAKVPAIRAAAEQFVLRLRWKDPEQPDRMVHLDDDDDLELLYESGNIAVVMVELEETSEETVEQLWTKERIALVKDAMNARQAEQRQGARAHQQAQFDQPKQTFAFTEVSSISERSYNGSNPYLPSAYQPFDGSADSVRSSNSSSPMSNMNPPPYPDSHKRGLSDVTLSDAMGHLSLKERLTNLIAEPAFLDASLTGGAAVQVVSVAISGREFKFPLEFKNAMTATNAELMGVLGKPLWIGQRSWGYKRLKFDEDDMTITYMPRKSSTRAKFQSDTEYHFTIFFDSRPLFRAAMENYSDKIETLTLEDFRPTFVSPISIVRDIGNDRMPITTEWACISPPVELLVENAKAGGRYHCVYVVKDARNPVLSESGRIRLQTWLKTQLIAGAWTSGGKPDSFGFGAHSNGVVHLA
ncbi:hypothetical protein M427DRAFT_71561 [Gonapodya prolifera JEL478]|uniref:Uncharacterized protein n=1 Tax=Gonapodya prolifera (strain JEL478) TaxID=1344416 RepID=A0A139A8N2_GONPJ|nr:hypothetical protein M427DRAFT_71561 [Gonapodya prolifera JEL478]|eukprot:KXS13161.1 hypothetical protein M427DRAFT_71561 [Gonapodya prolifera JEL478]